MSTFTSCEFVNNNVVFYINIAVVTLVADGLHICSPHIVHNTGLLRNLLLSNNKKAKSSTVNARVCWTLDGVHYACVWANEWHNQQFLYQIIPPQVVIDLEALPVSACQLYDVPHTISQSHGTPVPGRAESAPVASNVWCCLTNGHV